MQQNYGRNMEVITAGKFTGMNKARNACMFEASNQAISH
jgi:hypothetical protein